MVEGDVVVVFENVYDRATKEEIEDGVQTERVEIARHNDLNNLQQSITVKDLPSTGEELTRDLLLASLAVLVSGAGAMAFISKGRRAKN